MPEVKRLSVPAGSVVEATVRRVAGGAARVDQDQLAAEAPLEIRFRDRPFTVLMRTPGDDRELVAGFLYSEGIVARAADLVALDYSEAIVGDDCRNVIAVTLAPGVPAPGFERSFYASASCGVCGKVSLDDLVVRAPAIESELVIDAALLGTLPARLREMQPAFTATGGLHGAALFSADGTPLAAREDIGRHNAVDKLVGWAIGAGRLPLADALLVVSGRLGYEIVQKAIVAGIPLVAAVGAASSLAVALAERHGQTLATFLKPGSMNLFGDPRRVAVAAAPAGITRG